ncbi:MAG: choice-of-anchor D domain-containing protein, partial [Chitinivibrionia bacterium]|nr:choice-of-anchor D domain-containing protein [Chitinivibrionia bacterium]
GLIQQGASLTANTSAITPNLLSNYNVFWATETFLSFSSQEIHALTDWIEAGGSILLVGDESNAIGNYNTLLSSLNAGIRYAPGGAVAGTTFYIYPHVTSHGIGSIYIHHPSAHLSMISDPAVRLVADVKNPPIAAASVVGSGRIVAASEELFNDRAVGQAYNQLLGNQIMSWFLDGDGMQWLSVWPDSGSIAPGQGAEIEIHFSAAHVPAGDYDAEVAILSTSWDSVIAAVPACLHVIPASDIALSDASLAFEPLYIGTQTSLSFTVYNIGTDTLSVDSISIDSPSFSTDTTAYLLAPHASIMRTVTFHPLSRGVLTGALTMTTNDPDEGIVSVALRGEGQRPPFMKIAVDSLYERLLPGEASLRPVAVANLGDAELRFWVNVFEPRSGLPGSALKEAAALPAASPEVRSEPQYDLPYPGPSVPPATLKPEETAGAAQYIAWAGAAGSPFDSSTVFYENFEDTCFDGWVDGGGTSKREVTALAGATGTHCSYHEYNSSPGHFNGIHRTFGAVQPAHASFWVRSADLSQNNAYFVFRDSSGREVIWFFATSNGTFYINGGNGGHQTYPYSADTWYHVEFTNIDFGSKTFDYRVNDSLVKSGISFRNADLVHDMARLDMYNYSSNGEAWWDEILLSLTPHAAWARSDIRSGVVGGEDTRTIALTIDAANLTHGSYDAMVHVSTNMTANPALEIPLHLDVDSALTRTLALPLAAGWNTLGWNVDTEDDSFDSLFHSIRDNLIVAHGFDGGGLAFSPAIPQGFNTLGSLDHYHGVCVKLSAPDTLVIHGKALSDQSPHVLSPGYNLTSYLPYQEDSVGHALASILPSLEHVLGHDGGIPGIYKPHAFPGENTLAIVRPGSAYWLRLNEPDTLLFPGLPVYPSTPPFMAAREQAHAGSSEVIPTTEWVNVWGDSVWIDDHPIQAGMTIRAIDADRTVCGEYVVHSEGSFGVMPVYRDDPYTPQDEGALPGDFIIFYFDSIQSSRVFVWRENGEIIRYNDVPVGRPEEQNPPSKLVLHQNYPNPFNPLTTIEYELPEGIHVFLAIYTIEGKLVKTLIDAPRPAGSMHEIWDGRDAGGNPSASGIYLYRLQAGAAALTKKMVLIK